MSRALFESHDLQLTVEWLAGKGMVTERFTDPEIRAGKTPDFRVLRGGQLVAYCEVKSPRDPWLSEGFANEVPSRIVLGARDDPTFNRISGLVRKAVKQFDAVNPDRILPNIVVFVNWATANHFRDLDENSDRISQVGRWPQGANDAENCAGQNAGRKAPDRCICLVRGASAKT